MQPKKPVEPLVQAVVDSYNADEGTRHIDAGHLPNRDAIIELMRTIRELLFPGYFGKQNLTAEMLNYHVGELISIIRDKLFQQVRNAIRHQNDAAGRAPNAERAMTRRRRSSRNSWGRFHQHERRWRRM